MEMLTDTTCYLKVSPLPDVTSAVNVFIYKQLNACRDYLSNKHVFLYCQNLTVGYTAENVKGGGPLTPTDPNPHMYNVDHPQLTR